MGQEPGFDTLLLHGRTSKGFAQREILPPISQVTAYQYPSMEELAKVFAHKQMGYAYTRIGNPSVAVFEQRINELEGGAGALACSSGMAAVSAALLAVCQSGDEIIAGRGLYGGTIDLFHDLEKYGIRTVFTELVPEKVAPLINERTRVVFGEFISNPSLAVLDVEGVASVAHQAGIPLFVDATTVTPFLARPLSLGADVVIHSTSKYINGGGNSIGGVIVDGGHFSWDFDRHASLGEFRRFGRGAFLVRLRADLWKNLGCCIAPMNAFLSCVGLDTLGLRMERICANASALAQALSGEDGIRVNYLTLEGHPYRESALKYFRGQGGGILTFRAGSRERAFRIIDSLKYALIASNIGDLRTLVIHPASTLYLRTSTEEMNQAGVYDDTVRVSVGIEDSGDLIRDFLDAVRKA